MKIGILGSGQVGQTLAKGLKAEGHDVRIGSREGNKIPDFSKANGITEGSFGEVVAFAEIVVTALRGDVVEPTLKEHAKALAGKIILDPSNPISGAPENGALPYFTPQGDSIIQRAQKAVPDAKIVKWFNSTGAVMMVHPKVKGGTPSMFICGDDEGAKQTATKLAESLGWNVEDVGTSAMGHAVEALCQLWCAPGFTKNDWTHAFAVLRP